MEEQITFPNSSGEKLAGFLHVPAGTYSKGIVLAHCFTCSRHQRIVRKTCDKLASEGFLVLRFDFSGNGESEGKFEEATYTKEMKDLDSAVSFLMEKGIDEVKVFGHSMGAAVSILQSSADKRVKSLCVLASPSETTSIKDVFPKEKMEEIYSKGKAKVNIFHQAFVMAKEFFIDAERHDIKKSLKEFKRPFCVVHGDQDKIISVDNAKKLYSYASEPKELHIIEGADHLFSKQEDLKKRKI